MSNSAKMTDNAQIAVRYTIQLQHDYVWRCWSADEINSEIATAEGSTPEEALTNCQAKETPMTKRELLEKIGGTEGGVAMDAEILIKDRDSTITGLVEVHVENYSAGPIILLSEPV